MLLVFSRSPVHIDPLSLEVTLLLAFSRRRALVGPLSLCEQGLTSAEVETRAALYGPNCLKEPEKQVGFFCCWTVSLGEGVAGGVQTGGGEGGLLEDFAGRSLWRLSRVFVSRKGLA